MKLRNVLKEIKAKRVNLEALYNGGIIKYIPMSAECILKDLKEYLNCDILKYQLTYTKTTDKNKLRLYVLVEGGKE